MATGAFYKWLGFGSKSSFQFNYAACKKARPTMIFFIILLVISFSLGGCISGIALMWGQRDTRKAEPECVTKKLKDEREFLSCNYN